MTGWQEVYLQIDDEIFDLLIYCCNKYQCSAKDIIEDAIREYYTEDRRELRIKQRESEE